MRVTRAPGISQVTSSWSGARKLPPLGSTSLSRDYKAPICPLPRSSLFFARDVALRTFFAQPLRRQLTTTSGEEPILGTDIARHIHHLRSTKSLVEVLDIVCPDLRHCKDALDSDFITALLGRDTHAVSDLHDIAHAVGAHLGPLGWSALIDHALLHLGIHAACRLLDEARRRRPRVRLQTSVANQLIGHLVRPTAFYIPDPKSIQRAVSIFLSHSPADIDALPLLQALASTTSLPNRHRDIERILNVTRVLGRDAPHLSQAIDACLRCSSHKDAVHSLREHPDLSSHDLKRLLEIISRMRFAPDGMMPFAQLTEFMKYWKRRHFCVDSSVFVTYLLGTLDALRHFDLPWEQLGVSDFGTAVDKHIDKCERYVRKHYEKCADVRFYNALLRLVPMGLYTHLRFRRFWFAIKRRSNPISLHSVCAALLGASNEKRARIAWADYSKTFHPEPPASPTAWMYYAWYQAAHAEQQDRAVSILKRYVGDDPERARIAAVAAFAHARSPIALEKYAAALPRTWASPEVQEKLVKYRAYLQRWRRPPPFDVD